MSVFAHSLFAKRLQANLNDFDVFEEGSTNVCASAKVLKNFGCSNKCLC